MPAVASIITNVLPLVGQAINGLSNVANSVSDGLSNANLIGNMNDSLHESNEQMENAGNIEDAAGKISEKARKAALMSMITQQADAQTTRDSKQASAMGQI